MKIVEANANTGSHSLIDPWIVLPEWHDETVVCMATGPSLTKDQVDYCRGKARVIAVNDNYRIAPWADMLYACDFQWWQWHDGAKGFEGWRVTQDYDAAVEYGLKWIPSRKGNGLSQDPEYIHQGRNSGYQAINLAYLLGASRVVLLGYDMTSAPVPHWFGHHPGGLVPIYEEYIRCFNTIGKQGAVEVINCTAQTKLTCFPLADIRDVI